MGEKVYILNQNLYLATQQPHAGPTLNQHCLHVSCLLNYCPFLLQIILFEGQIKAKDVISTLTVKHILDVYHVILLLFDVKRQPVLLRVMYYRHIALENYYMMLSVVMIVCNTPS